MQLTSSPVDLRPDIAWKHRLGNWSVYAAAAGATLAMASKADADIMYSGPVDLTVQVSTALADGASIARTKIEGYYASLFLENQTLGGGRKQAFALVSGTGALGFVEGTNGVKKYAASQPIRGTGPTTTFSTLRSAGASGVRGVFGPGTVTGFVGFKAPNGTLGWIQIKVADRNSNGYPDEAEIIDFAYNSTPGGPINAGQISSVPEPSSVSLGLLAIGASGLIAWRRRRSHATNLRGQTKCN